MTTLELNGTWQLLGPDGPRDVPVPGLATDPRRLNAEPVRYRRRVCLPDGDWTAATLTLNGARFAPKVYIDGRQVCSAPGGMAPTKHLLAGDSIAPGKAVDLEIELAGLDDLPDDDASKIPHADRWRSNISSCLWDVVRLRTHRGARLLRLVPGADPAAGRAQVRWQFQRLGHEGDIDVRIEILKTDGTLLAERRIDAQAEDGSADLPLPQTVRPWSPEMPNLYRLRVSLLAGPNVLDVDQMAFAPRRFAVADKGFTLNGREITLRAGSVVWHRWIRDPEARRLGFDLDWFETHIVDRLKAHGANTLRFHLGTPPEAMLDLCDRKGLCVQLEWLFFHGMAASRQSLLDQWRSWLDLAARHPSVVLVHPWNETEGDQLETAFGAIRELAVEYPPMVVSHRDVTHVHKYWWSLFENVGIYYDSAEQFDQPIMVDEFGGNYLDGDCNPGGYPALAESFLRFLGKNHTAEQRLWLHTVSNCRIAEYWRRIGAAGFSPFCIAGSWEDGNHHFLGPLAEARPKPVWDAMTAAYAPVSVSLDCWDRNFPTGAKIQLPVMLFNETGRARTVRARVRLTGADGHLSEVDVEGDCRAHENIETLAVLQLPGEATDVELTATLDVACPGVDKPVVSRWTGRTLKPVVPQPLAEANVGIHPDDTELRTWWTRTGLHSCDWRDGQAEAILGGRALWEALGRDPQAAEALESALQRGCGAVLLDVGPRPLGQGYLDGGDLGPLQGGMWIQQPEVQTTPLPMGVTLEFTEMPEPESCLHPAENGQALWNHLPREASWLWNGYRGGLIVPAADMQPSGLSQEAFVALWTQRGADPEDLRSGACLAYELAGFYAFSRTPSDEVRRELREKVRFLVDDAPALAGAINPNAPIRTIDLAAGYQSAASGRARNLVALARCGKNLTRTPVQAVEFGPGTGRLLVSQLLTQGRLAEGFGSEGRYGVRPDPAAGQMVLNMVEYTLQPERRDDA